MNNLMKKLCRIRPGHILAVLFVLYIMLVASTCLPGAVYETGRFLYWKTGYQNFIDSVDSHCEDFLAFDQDRIPVLDKGTYINLNGLMAKTLRQPTLNKRTLLTNGLLASISDAAPSEEELQEAADNLIRFCREHEKNGGNFLFVMAPSKISKYEDVLPVGFTDTDNETADRLLELLEAGGVPLLDLRETLRAAGIPWNEAFFVTDHHWTPQVGFLAYREITNTLTPELDPFYTDERNYTFHIYEDTFLGSAGKRTGVYFAGIDDSVFIAPDFPTDLQLAIPDLEVDLRGSYQQVSYHQESGMDLDNPDPFNDNMYGLYGWGDPAMSHWRNEQAPVDQKLLLIGDSFANVPFSLMSLCYSSCDEVDMRYFEEDFEEYYEAYQPQSVVLLINPNNCSSEFTCRTYLTGEK